MNVQLKVQVLLAGKPQIQLARELGISEAQLSRIIQGWATPCQELKTRIASLLGCKVEDIFGPGRVMEKKGCYSIQTGSGESIKDGSQF